MSGLIGYYVHHHGDGHRQRAMAIASQAPDRFVLIGTGLTERSQGLPCLDLPDDQLIGAEAPAHPRGPPGQSAALHYEPKDHDGIRQRVAVLANWIAREQPAALVVDVSVEVAMLARLASTPTIYVRLAGVRDDPAHLEAFHGALALLAPFHQDLDDPMTLAWVTAKSHFVPGLTAAVRTRPPQPNIVLVVYGKGGFGGGGDALADAARATPKLRWRVIGPASAPAASPPNLTLLGWVEDAAAEFANAGVIIGGAGDGVVNMVLAAARPFVCLPEQRPFGEQIAKAQRLAALGAAILLPSWPTPGAWAQILARARSLSVEASARLHDPLGPRKAAEFLIAMAAG